MPRSWRWWTTLDNEIPSSPDTHQICLFGYSLGIHILGLLVLFWASSFWQTEQNFFNHMFTFFWLHCAFTFHTQMFVVACTVLWHHFKLVKHFCKIWPYYTFISVIFKSYTEWSNTQCNSTPTTLILPITVANFCCILTFDLGKNAIQSDAPEGSDTFQWQLWEEIAQVSSANNMGQGEGPTSEWCTGREWPVNCMTVISAWWWSNMP